MELSKIWKQIKINIVEVAYFQIETNCFWNFILLEKISSEVIRRKKGDTTKYKKNITLWCHVILLDLLFFIVPVSVVLVTLLQQFKLSIYCIWMKKDIKIIYTTIWNMYVHVPNVLGNFLFSLWDWKTHVYILCGFFTQQFIARTWKV